MKNKGRLIGCMLLALIQANNGVLAADRVPLRFPVLADGIMRFDPKSVADQERLRSILGDEHYQVLMKEAQKEKGYPVYVDAKKPVGQSTAGEVAALVREMRDNICIALKKGDEFKFTMAWDASAKVWGIGISGNSGIEVTIKCGK